MRLLLYVDFGDHGRQSDAYDGAAGRHHGERETAYGQVRWYPFMYICGIRRMMNLFSFHR